VDLNYRFNRKDLNECCIATLTGELFRRKESHESLMKEGDTVSCECGNRMICEPGETDKRLRWGRGEP
jgi:hypothetical protein